MSSFRPAPLPPARRHRSAADALSGIQAVVWSSAIIAGLYLGRDFLIPLSLAALITFLLAPFVTKLERWIGNVAAVIATMTMILAGTVALGWVLGNQAVDLANQFPGYKENIRTKLHAVRIPSGGAFDRVKETVLDLKKDLPGGEEESAENTPPGSEGPQPVKVVETPDSTPFQMVKSMAAPVLGPLGTAGLVMLLATFMLLKREDLRGRVIRLIGQGNISATTRAMEDAGTRVRRYLLMQLVVNVSYGIPLAIGLYFIGVPNAVLWGTLAAVLRFIPYIGPWIAAAFPILLSLAVSPSWLTPLLTMGLFVVLELVSNNVLEPWLYGASTGVSSVALIIAAVFWTWMWGTPGLVLTTPFTVCLVVMGRHIPQLSFLSVVLGEEEALTPAEDCYHRMLRHGEHDETELVEAYLKSHPPVDLYDSVLLPVIAAAEEDHRQGTIDGEQRDRILKSVSDIIEDQGERHAAPDDEGDALPPCNIRCIPARAARDELAGAMLADILQRRGFEAGSFPARRSAGEFAEELGKELPDLVCLMVVPPSKPIHARNLCRKIRAVLPGQKLAVFLGESGKDEEEELKALREAGAEEVFRSLSDAESWCARFAVRLAQHRESPPLPKDEDERLETLERLGLLNPEREPVLDRIAAKMARIFEAPVAAVTLIDRERQFFKAHSGLPEELAEKGFSPRDLSVCSHVVAANAPIVVEDLKRDHRFTGNPLLVKHALRFYAGAPIRSSGGQALGALCVMDVVPRRFTESERRFLEQYAAEVAEEIERLAPAAP